MTSPQQIEILDIRHFNARQLRPLLEGEAAVWRKRLRWDYSTSTDLLLQYLDSRILPGFVALTRGRICGYTFCVFEGPKAVVGDIYASHESDDPLAVSFNLARNLLDMLESAPDIDRIEAQLLLFDAGILPPSSPASRSSRASSSSTTSDPGQSHPNPPPFRRNSSYAPGPNPSTSPPPPSSKPPTPTTLTPTSTTSTAP